MKEHSRGYLQKALLYNWSFSQNARVHWLIHGHMTFNKQTVFLQTSHEWATFAKAGNIDVRG